MTRPTLRALVCGPVTAVVLITVGGCAGGSVDEAAATGAAQPAEQGSPPVADPGSGNSGSDSNSGDSHSGDSASEEGDGSRPGGPDAEAAAEGARPGAPWDVEAFEQEGAPYYAAFPDQAAEHCADGRCVLTFTGTPVDQATEDGCSIHFASPPPVRPNPSDPAHNVMQRGSQVTVEIRCTSDGPTDGTTDGTTDEPTDATKPTPTEPTVDEGSTDDSTDATESPASGAPGESG